MAAQISNSRKLGFVDALVVSREDKSGRWPEFVKKEKKKKGTGKKGGKRKEMRGRTRELCREANDSQNWFAGIMRNGKGRKPRIVLRCPENIPRLRKRVLHEKRSGVSS